MKQHQGKNDPKCQICLLPKHKDPGCIYQDLIYKKYFEAGLEWEHRISSIYARGRRDGLMKPKKVGKIKKKCLKVPVIFKTPKSRVISRPQD